MEKPENNGFGNFQSRISHEGLSSLSTPSGFTEDESSLSIVDLDALPDAHRSVSFVHVENKSSLGSFLDHCFSTDDQKSESSQVRNITEHFRSNELDGTYDSSMQCTEPPSTGPTQPLNEVSFLQNLKSPFAEGSGDSINSEFDFNPDELDIDILINEEDGNLNDTLVEHNQSMKAVTTEDNPSQSYHDSDSIPDKDSTTFEFLKGLGLAGSPNKPHQSQPMDISRQGDGSYTAAYIDSLYFAPGIGQPTPLHPDNKSHFYDESSMFGKQTLSGSMDNDFGEDVSDGKPDPKSSSTIKKDPFDDMVCGKPLNFSGLEFQNNSVLPTNMFSDDQFTSADDAEKLLDKEEESFEKENRFVLNQDFVASNEESALGDFSTYRMPNMSVQEEGGLDAEKSAERPSFGMKVRTPSPQKPCKLVSTSNLTNVEDSSSNASKSEPDSSDSTTSSVIDLSTIKLGETIDQSLMMSISKAISNMSATMSNEELAQFIFALSNRKMELQKQIKQSKSDGSEQVAAEGMDGSTVQSCNYRDTQSISHSQASLEAEDVMDSTLKNEEMALNEQLSQHSDPTIPEGLDAHKSVAEQLQQTQVSSSATSSTDPEEKTEEEDNLAPLPSNETIFSPSSTDQRILSSTRANLSLTRGSLSRESIEKLHHQLRGHVDGKSRDTALPDVVSDQSNKAHSMTLTSSKLDSSQFPLSHSSPPFHSCISESSTSSRFSPPEEKMKSTDVTLTRLSAAFHRLHPSHSFEELATIAESQVDEKQLPDEFHEDENDKKDVEEKETLRTSSDTRDELPSCASVDPIPKASSTRTSNSRSFSRSSEITQPSADQSLSSQMSTQSSTSNQPYSSSSYHRYLAPTALLPSYTSHLPQEAHLFPHVQPSLALLPTGPQMGRPLSAVSANYDSTVYSAASTGGYSYPYQPVPTVLSLPNRGGYHGVGYCDDILPCITTPNGLRFDSILCVGVPSKVLLPLKNTGSRWVQIELRCLSITINQKTAPLNHESYVCLKQKHVVGPHSKEDTDVAVIGHEPGSYHIVIEVISTLICMEGSRSSGQRCTVSTLSVVADVDVPSVSLYGTYEVPSDIKQNRLIDFGEIVLGSSKSLPLRILNKGKVEVPLRILILTPSHECSSFSLSLSSSAVQQDQNNPSSLTALRTVLTVSDQPNTVWVHFHSTTRRSHPDEKPMKIEGRIEAVLDAPFKSVENSFNLSQVEAMLDSISLSALVGIGKLHAPRSQQMLTFTANRGSCDMKKIPVRNAGNVSVEVSFGLENRHGLFTLIPTTAVLPPGDDVQLTVEFRPPSSAQVTQKNNPITSLIFMNILPSGPQFEVQVHGIVTSSSSDTSLSHAPSPSLLTNKNRLRWGGVPIGKSQKQKLMLRTVSSTNPIKFRCSIKSDSLSSFQILSSCNGFEELVRNSIMAVIPGHDQALSIIFTPCRKNMVHAKLEIKTPIEDLPATKYTIPLSGYGGTGQIRIEGLDRSLTSGIPLHNGYVPELYIMKSDDLRNEIKVSNCGSRSAFVKLVAYSDSSLDRISPTVLCSPSQFILDERQSRSITIRCISSPTSSFYICVWHGDELSRLLMRKALRAHPTASSLLARCIPQTHSYLRSISFDGIFDREDHWNEEDLKDVEPHSYDVQIFYLNIKQTLVEIKPDIRNIASSSGNTTSNLSCQDLPVKDVDPKQDVALVMPSAHLPDLAPSSFSLNWSVTPTHITLTLPPKGGCVIQPLSEPIRVKITNRSLASLMYDVIWPGHYVTITPQRGRVEPESVGILLVSPNPSLASSGSLLPWCGQAMVLAIGGGSSGAENSRIIYIQIKDVVTSYDTSSNAESQEGCDDVSKEPDSVPSISKLQVYNNLLEFAPVAIGNNAKSQLEFRNLSKNSIKWMLSSVAPPYVKNSASSDPGSIFRSTYAAFIFSHRSGSLEPGARVQIPVTFNPMNVGIYSQHWEIEYHDAADIAALTLQREKIQLSGKGTSPLHGFQTQPVSRKSELRHDIYVTESCYWFPDTPLNRSSIIKIPIKNKAQASRTVKFINLRPPFYITHQKHSIRSMCCANLPVTFKPTQKGPYSDILVIQSEGSPDVRITLKAKAVAN